MPLNGDGGGYYPILSVYGNLHIPVEKPLEVNNHIPNLIVLSNSFGTMGSSIESRGGPLSPSNKNDEGNSKTLVYLEVIACLTSSAHYHEEMKATIISQNETKAHYLSKTFAATSD